MNPMLQKCLDDLEARLDPDEEARLLQAWREFAAGEAAGFGGVFAPKRSRPNLPQVAWPSVSVNAALNDFDQMALQQYGQCSAQLAAASGALLNVRCNYGTSILPLLFGAQVFVMDEALDTLPTSRPLNDARAIRRLIAAGVPDLQTGFGARVFEMGERFAALAQAYPRLGQCIHVFHPDLQGPLDIAEVVWGSSLFLAVRDEPQMVHDFLCLIVETYMAFMRAWTRIWPFAAEGNTHWGMFYKGSLMLRDDSATNLSRRMVEQFVLPYDQRLLDEFGGGAVHFCGKGDHFIAALASLRGLSAVNISQPELNAMERVFENTVDKGVKLIGLGRQAAEQALARGRDLRGQAHAW